MTTAPSPLRRRLTRAALLCAATVAVAMTAIVWRLLPHQPLHAGVPLSTAVYDADGKLLRLTLAGDGQYRLWTPLEKISPELVAATVLYEDRHFFHHPGVNPLALARAAVTTYGAGGRRVGGSTITMQLARRLYGFPSRSLTGKLRQLAGAIGLELGYSKRDIIEAYLNLVPYGGNIEGAGAAAAIYFRKPARALTLGESLTLAVIPQNPTRRGRLGDGADQETRAARLGLLESLLARRPELRPEKAALATPPPRRAPDALPFAAPHFVEQILAGADADTRGGSVTTTLDGRLQRLVERHLGAYVARKHGHGIHNAVAELVDFRTREVKALVGSASFFDTTIAGQVDGTLARRSPGSTLKPFVYALGLEQGVIHPLTMLRDVPLAFGSYSPENFDGRFAGPLAAKDALVRSRNIPALAVAAKLSGPSLYEFLKTAGVSLPESEAHYGLGLTLGTGEVTMDELVTLYTMLANHGVLAPLRKRRDQPADAPGTRVLSEEAAHLVLGMLEENPRLHTSLAGATPVGHLPVAWKTGTSWGFRDAWTVGVFGPYVLAVWVGDFSGEGNPAFVGAQAAAPLFFEIVDSLEAQGPALSSVRPTPTPAGLRRVEVCALSGGTPTPSCPHRRKTWFIAGRSPVEPCAIHRTIALDSHGRRTCAGGPPTARSEVFEVWPSDMAKLFAAAGLPRRPLPPAAPGCDGDPSGQGRAPRITSPLAGVTYTVRADRAGGGVGGVGDRIALSAVTDGDARDLYWFVDETLIGRAPSGTTLFWKPSPGRFTVRAVDDLGRAGTRPLAVAWAP